MTIWHALKLYQSEPSLHLRTVDEVQNTRNSLRG